MTVASGKAYSGQMKFNAQPLTANCRAVLHTRDHCCLGISPFNSYFTEDRIRNLAGWAMRNFSAAHFFIPDAPAAYTLEAVGYAPEKAAWKARRQGQYLRNKVRRALRDVGVDDPDALILDSAALSVNGHYERLLRQADQLFRSHPAFARECLEASRWVLSKRLIGDIDPTEEQLRRAVRYLLAELPLFVDAAGIVGSRLSVFCYHQSIPFLQRLYEGQLALRAAAQQGFAVLTPATSGDRQAAACYARP